MILWIVIAFQLGGIVGWFGGYCFGWLKGVKETEERWSDAVSRYEDSVEW